MHWCSDVFLSCMRFIGSNGAKGDIGRDELVTGSGAEHGVDMRSRVRGEFFQRLSGTVN